MYIEKGLLFYCLFHLMFESYVLIKHVNLLNIEKSTICLFIYNVWGIEMSQKLENSTGYSSILTDYFFRKQQIHVQQYCIEPQTPTPPFVAYLLLEIISTALCIWVQLFHHVLHH